MLIAAFFLITPTIRIYCGRGADKQIVILQKMGDISALKGTHCLFTQLHEKR